MSRATIEMPRDKGAKSELCETLGGALGDVCRQGSGSETRSTSVFVRSLLNVALAGKATTLPSWPEEASRDARGDTKAQAEQLL